VREGKIKVIGPHFVIDEIDPVMIAPFFHQEEEIIIFPVGDVEVRAVTKTAADLFNFKKIVPVTAGLLQGIMRDDLFGCRCVQKGMIYRQS
jgi:hypothetical protein